MPSCPVCLWHSPSPSFGLSAPILQDRQPTTPNSGGDKLQQPSKQLSTLQMPLLGILHCFCISDSCQCKSGQEPHHLYFVLMKHLSQDKRDTYDKYIELQNYQPLLHLYFTRAITINPSGCLKQSALCLCLSGACQCQHWPPALHYRHICHMPMQD